LAKAGLAIPVDARDLAPPFRLQDALDPRTVAGFRDHVTPAARVAFDQGLTYLQAARYADAETSLRRALRDDSESVASLAYLGACFAAAGHDREAGQVWRTAIARDPGVAPLQEWLGEALMRNQLFGDAKTVLERARDRWPSDTRFARSLALVYATTGNGSEAVRTLDRFLGDHTNDLHSKYLVIEWLFTVHRAGGWVYDRPSDLARARTYAEQYLGSDLPNQPLVKQWLEYLEREKP
jgi:tetratricopeptide (TPR) repeat protein